MKRAHGLTHLLFSSWSFLSCSPGFDVKNTLKGLSTCNQTEKSLNVFALSSCALSLSEATSEVSSHLFFSNT